MKWMKLAAAAVFAFAFGNAYAFHDGGVADCDGCHVMHNASSGASVTVNGIAPGAAKRSNLGNSYLLQGQDQSSTCLNCHNGAKAAFEDFRVANLGTTNGGPAGDGSAVNFNPGGDFGWLQVTETYHPWDGAGTTVQEIGERHGHNIVAADFGLVADAAITVAPGGTYAPGTGLQAFACSSCHDPHGKQRVVVGQAVPGTPAVGAAAGPYSLPIAMSGSYGDLPTAQYAVGVYRLLGGVNYAPLSNNAFPFPNPSPIAVAPSLGGAAAPFGYNQVEYNGGPTEVRVAYGTGMSEWCQNCHTNIHMDGYISGAANQRHPAGSNAHFRQAQADAYNSYVSSGVFTATSQYTSLVPFETGLNATQIAALKAASSHTGVPGVGDGAATPLFATVGANVMCLSCHRAHASAFGSMTRWNMAYEFLTEGGLVADPLAPVNHGLDDTHFKAAYYGRDVNAGLGIYQRSMCNKCHAKD